MKRLTLGVVLACIVCLACVLNFVHITILIRPRWGDGPFVLSSSFYQSNEQERILLENRRWLPNKTTSGAIYNFPSSKNSTSSLTVEEIELTRLRQVNPSYKNSSSSLTIHEIELTRLRQVNLHQYLIASDRSLPLSFSSEAALTGGKNVFTVQNQVQYHPFPFKERADNLFYKSRFESYLPFVESKFFEGKETDDSRDIKKKKIILWWQQKSGVLPNNELTPLRVCPDFPCVVTSDRRFTGNSSVIIVNSRYVLKENPPDLKPHQVLVHYQTDPPVPSEFWIHGNLFTNTSRWLHVFNWTMSYRQDSDVPVPYGRVLRLREPRVRNYSQILASKTGLVAAIITRCSTGSKLEEYVRELRDNIPVDVYGACGLFHCPRNNHSNCLDFISKKYKFYLSFEDHLCKDYITEKFFRYLDKDMVLIARAGASFTGVAPPGVFINTAGFKSPAELAERISYLDAHDDEYVKMLEEKDRYAAVFEDYPLQRFRPTFLEFRYEAVPVCELCRRAWNLDTYAKVVPDIRAWFGNHDYQCRSPEDLDERYF